MTSDEQLEQIMGAARAALPAWVPRELFDAYLAANRLRLAARLAARAVPSTTPHVDRIAAVTSAQIVARYPPVLTTVDWGSRPRGQGRRVGGGMITGAMSDVTIQSKKTYSDPLGNVPDMEPDDRKVIQIHEGRALSRAAHSYLQARVAGYSHEAAMLYALATDEGDPADEIEAVLRGAVASPTAAPARRLETPAKGYAGLISAVRPPVAPRGRVGRRFYSCYACRHVVAVDGDLAPEACACGGKLELLGRVGRASKGLIRDSERTACDARCTNAPGPSCECRCGGVNHGTGRVVPVEIDAGGVPRLVVAHVGELRARAAEYADAVAPLRARLRALREARAGRTWRTDEEIRLNDALARIRALRTHKGRLKAIAAMGNT